jgi:hypothetical protein
MAIPDRRCSANKSAGTSGDKESWDDDSVVVGPGTGVGSDDRIAVGEGAGVGSDDGVAAACSRYGGIAHNIILHLLGRHIKISLLII